MDTEEFLAVAEDLLAVPSTADRPAELERALELVLDFTGPGFTVERFSSGGKPSALLYPGPDRPRSGIILNGHLDVVPAGPEQFRPRREGDRLYARGAHDMKVAALAEALAFRELARELPYPLALQLVTDEETFGRHGTRHQLEQGVRADFVVIGEQSALRVVTASKGIIAASLEASGRSGHAAYPWDGDNALVSLMASVTSLLGAYPVPEAEAWRTTVSVARVETPNQARNQIPDRARAELDIRYPPEDADLNGKTEAEVAGYLTRFCAPGVSAVVHRADPPHYADPGRPEVARLQQAARRQGFSGDLLRKHGAADSRFYYQYGIDAVIFGIGGSGLHGDDEYADLTTLEPYYQALTDFLRDPGLGS